MAAEVHQHYGLAKPTKTDLIACWWRGLFAGLFGDRSAKQLGHRVWQRASGWVSNSLARRR